MKHYLLENHDAAAALVATLTTDTLADILNGLLTIQDQEGVDDDVADAGTRLFEEICGLCPDAVELAVTK